jgi:hypothetical protein
MMSLTNLLTTLFMLGSQVKNRKNLSLNLYTVQPGICEIQPVLLSDNGGMVRYHQTITKHLNWVKAQLLPMRG